jgi:hypothetical protein
MASSFGELYRTMSRANSLVPSNIFGGRFRWGLLVGLSVGLFVGDLVGLSVGDVILWEM